MVVAIVVFTVTAWDLVFEKNGAGQARWGVLEGEGGERGMGRRGRGGDQTSWVRLNLDARNEVNCSWHL